MDEIIRERLLAQLQTARDNCKFYVNLYRLSNDKMNKEIFLESIKFYQQKIEEIKIKLLDCDDDEVDTFTV